MVATAASLLTLTHTPTHLHTPTPSLTHIPTHTPPPSLKHTHPHTLTHTYTHTSSHIPTHPHSHIPSHLHSHMHTSHTLTNTLSLLMSRTPAGGAPPAEHFVAGDTETVWTWLRDLLCCQQHRWEIRRISLQGSLLHSIPE